MQVDSLTAYLYVIGAEDSDLCDECRQQETGTHVLLLLDCRRWKFEGLKLKRAVRTKADGAICRTYWLGGGGKGTLSGRKDLAGRHRHGATCITHIIELTPEF